MLSIIENGEDSSHQFKSDITNADSLGAEMVAFSNSGGGIILIGVSDGSKLFGLGEGDVRRLNQMISNAATQNVRPPISPSTKNFSLEGGKIIAVTIPSGMSKPYLDTHGQVWVKSGSDKRRVTAREELQRMYQESGLVYGDEVPVSGTSVSDIDRGCFEMFCERHIQLSVDIQEMPLDKLLENMNLAKDNQLNVAGTLLFATKPQFYLPLFIVKAVSFPAKSITDTNYIDSQDIDGKMSEIFRRSMTFMLSNIHHVQNEQSVNSLGEPEIPKIVFEELIVNALIHRDYFVRDSIKILMFSDRIEIVSPGHLPNDLTVEKIKQGNANVRNAKLHAFAPSVLPYRGLGSGIQRALSAYGDIEFIDDPNGNAFKAVIWRKMVNPGKGEE